VKRGAAGIGKRIASYRGKMSAQQLADRCKALGMPSLSRIVITRLENGRREAVSTAEILILAQALEVTPVELLFPLGSAETVELSDGRSVPTWEALTWFTGEALPASETIGLFRLHQQLVDRYLITARRSSAAEAEIAGQLLDVTVQQIRDVRKAMRNRGLLAPDLAPELARILSEPQPVVAAIVASDRGVLVGRRNDGSPLWTFIAGEVEPGESAADAAIREVKEETGCLVQTGSLIGQRVHPKTGRLMMYMAAAPTHGTDIFVGDEAELAEVRWVSLAEADKLMPDMFAPVHAYLERVLKDG
jgi:8-oxo-dGTP pyrophosphatase MutT (NUDIX family)/transcriptional regulator with XRE-family HTH domain